MVHIIEDMRSWMWMLIPQGDEGGITASLTPQLARTVDNATLAATDAVNSMDAICFGWWR